jgi:uncharacterized protein (UPF0248 family)
MAMLFSKRGFTQTLSRVKKREDFYKERKRKMEFIPESKFEDKRSIIIDQLVEQNVFKIDGRQLYELSLYELMKTYTEEP